MLNLHNKIRKQISYLLLPAMMMFTFSAFAPFSYGSVYHLDSLDHLDRFDKQKTVSENNKIEFYYNNGKIIDESDGTNTSSYLIAKHRILRSVNTINQQPSTNNQAQWLISNGKDVVATTDGSANGNGTALPNYTPYGQSIDFRSGILNNQSNIQNPTSNINTNPFKYSGYYSDAESGLYYLNARYYSPELMRFINRDSYDFANRYAYCDSDPISEMDHTGHQSKLWGILNFALAIGVGYVVGALLPEAVTVWGSMGINAITGAAASGMPDTFEQGLTSCKKGNFLSKINWKDVELQAVIGAGLGVVFGAIGYDGIGRKPKTPVSASNEVRRALAESDGRLRRAVASIEGGGGNEVDEAQAAITGDDVAPEESSPGRLPPAPVDWPPPGGEEPAAPPPQVPREPSPSPLTQWDTSTGVHTGTFRPGCSSGAGAPLEEAFSPAPLSPEVAPEAVAVKKATVHNWRRLATTDAAGRRYRW